jgi:hypothetical protein
LVINGSFLRIFFEKWEKLRKIEKLEQNFDVSKENFHRGEGF